MVAVCFAHPDWPILQQPIYSGSSKVTKGAPMTPRWPIRIGFCNTESESYLLSFLTPVLTLSLLGKKSCYELRVCKNRSLTDLCPCNYLFLPPSKKKGDISFCCQNAALNGAVSKFQPMRALLGAFVTNGKVVVSGCVWWRRPPF